MTDATFVEIRDASGQYAVGKRVAVFRWNANGEEFELSEHDTHIRRDNGVKYGVGYTEEDLALAAFAGGAGS